MILVSIFLLVAVYFNTHNHNYAYILNSFFLNRINIKSNDTKPIIKILRKLICFETENTS